MADEKAIISMDHYRELVKAQARYEFLIDFIKKDFSTKENLEAIVAGWELEEEKENG